MTAPQVISADSHVQEPPELYAEWIPSKYRAKAPHVEKRNGGRYMIVDGKRPRRLDIAAAATNDDDQNREFRDDDEGGRNIERRLKDLARDGVTGEVIYPNSSLALFNSDDAGYQIAVAQAYNDWAADFAAEAPGRLASVALLSPNSAQSATNELVRIAREGRIKQAGFLVNDVSTDM